MMMQDMSGLHGWQKLQQDVPLTCDLGRMR